MSSDDADTSLIAEQSNQDPIDETQAGAEGEAPIEPPTVAVTPELVAPNISLLARTSNGLSHAYVKLNLQKKGITVLEGLNQYPHLRYVDFSENAIKQIDELAFLEYLLTVDLHGNRLRQVPNNIEKCKYLQSANFSNNKISSFEANALAYLVNLNLNQNELPEIFLRDYPQLNQLEVRGNKLTTTNGINAPKIKKIYMAKNEISKLDGLSDKSELEILHLRENKISTLGGLTSSMASLSYLNLRSNLVENVSEIDHLKELPKLKHLNLMDNPICQIANYRIEVLSRIPHLEQLDKNQFTVEEKEAASNLQVEREKAAANAGAAEDQAA